MAERGLSARQVVRRLPAPTIPTAYRILSGTTRDPLIGTLLAQDVDDPASQIGIPPRDRPSSPPAHREAYLGQRGASSETVTSARPAAIGPHSIGTRIELPLRHSAVSERIVGRRASRLMHRTVTVCRASR